MTVFVKGQKCSNFFYFQTMLLVFSTLIFGPPLKFKTFPDGGKAAWSVVGGVFVSYGLAFGLLRVFSVLLNPIQSYYGVSQTTAMLAPGLKDMHIFLKRYNKFFKSII